jgi:hypothetical protein
LEQWSKYSSHSISLQSGTIIPPPRRYFPSLITIGYNFQLLLKHVTATDNFIRIERRFGHGHDVYMSYL